MYCSHLLPKLVNKQEKSSQDVSELSEVSTETSQTSLNLPRRNSYPSLCEGFAKPPEKIHNGTINRMMNPYLHNHHRHDKNLYFMANNKLNVKHPPIMSNFTIKKPDLKTSDSNQMFKNTELSETSNQENQQNNSFKD